ncbi:MAG: RHS repeat-associated core domain-containing protein [Dehalococcoidia bacterium]
MAIVDDAGAVQNSYTYDVYGEASVTGSLANEFDFAGQQTDGDTGLQYLRARYMDPETGVFFSRDPLAAMPGWLGSHFGYADAGPVSRTDPTGLWGVDDFRQGANPCNWGPVPRKICGETKEDLDELVEALREYTGQTIQLVREYIVTREEVAGCRADWKLCVAVFGVRGATYLAGALTSSAVKIACVETVGVACFLVVIESTGRQIVLGAINRGLRERLKERGREALRDKDPDIGRGIGH